MLRTKSAIFLLCLLVVSLTMLRTRPSYADNKLPWNGKEISGWVCDGRILKPKSGANSKNTWTFDGREIKPKSGATSANTWLWDGKELKPKSGANSKNTWVISSGKAKPKSGANAGNTWSIGNAPILVIAGAVALRLY